MALLATISLNYIQHNCTRHISIECCYPEFLDYLNVILSVFMLNVVMLNATAPNKRRHDTQHNDIQHNDTQHNGK
jgi:hypothetical protein